MQNFNINEFLKQFAGVIILFLIGLIAGIISIVIALSIAYVFWNFSKKKYSISFLVGGIIGFIGFCYFITNIMGIF